MNAVNQRIVILAAALAAWIVPPWSALAQCDHDQSAKIRPDGRRIQDHFGESVVLQGETAAIGARWDSESAFHAGAAYVFRFLADGSQRWGQVVKLRASNGVENDQFGFGVAMRDNIVVVGAPWADPRGSASGGVYVFWEIGPHWIEEVELTPEDGAPEDRFGWSVALGDRFVVVGAKSDDNDQVDSGSVYVFRRDRSRWVQEAKLRPEDIAADDRFGSSVAFWEDRIIVGSPGDDDGGEESGSAYVFRRDENDSGRWVQEAKLVAEDSAERDQFGFSVSIFRDKAIVGAHQDDDQGQQSGSAYVFRFDGGGSDEWSQEAKLLAENGGSGERFGSAVAIQGATAVVGARWDAQNGAHAGAAYSFTFDADGNGRWIQRDKLVARDGRRDQEFGGSVSLSDDTTLIGAGGTSSGAAYVFPAGCCNRSPDWLCDGDVDGNGQVNPTDIGLIQAHYGDRNLQALCNYDLDCDHQINAVDAGIVQSLFGTCRTPRISCELGDADEDRIADVYETNDGLHIDDSHTGTDPNNPDTDGDGILDGDEAYGTMAGLDLPSLGASPVLKDVFLEIDWMFDLVDCGWHGHRPSAEAVQALVDAFAAASTPNPYGAPAGIRLHVDFGQGPPFTGGEAIGVDDVVDWDQEFHLYKEDFFDPIRAGYFHYAIFCHRYDRSNNGSSGIAEVGGDDFIVSLQCALNDSNVSKTTMHELGHNFGLLHGGVNGPNYKPNYNSVMNYRYQFTGVDVDCDAAGDDLLDFSRGERIDLDEDHLDETEGVCGGVPINWDGGGIDRDIARNINCVGGASSECGVSIQACIDDECQVLEDHDDWSLIVLGIRQDGEGPAPPSVICQDVPQSP